MDTASQDQALGENKLMDNSLTIAEFAELLFDLAT